MGLEMERYTWRRVDHQPSQTKSFAFEELYSVSLSGLDSSLAAELELKVVLLPVNML